YLERLRAGGAERVWVEKILAPDERLRDWPVCGTVGYDFLNDACALFVNPAGERPLTRLWESVSGDRRPFEEVAFEAKYEQTRTSLGYSSLTARPPSSPAFSRQRRRSRPRASRTPRSIATGGCWRSMTSAATPPGSGSTWSGSTPGAWSEPNGSRSGC